MPTACPQEASTPAGTSDIPLTLPASLDVSVCIVNWNCRDHLRACLRSLNAQRQGLPLEVIVVDNASSDGAADMVAAEFPQVRLICNTENVGFSRANNQAARLARGRYVFFLNNDTEVPALGLRRLVAFADQHPDIGLLGPRLRGADGTVQVSYRPRPSVGQFLQRTTLLRWTALFQRAYQRFRRDEFDPDSTHDVDILMGAAVLLRREQFWAWGGWDERFTFGGEDMELSTRVQRHARVVYWPGVEILHHGRTSTRQHPQFTSPNIAIGFTRYLRLAGASPASLLLYKLVLTLDAPLTALLKFGEYLWRTLHGDAERAEKSWRSAEWAWFLLTRGLGEIWRI